MGRSSEDFSAVGWLCDLQEILGPLELNIIICKMGTLQRLVLTTNVH